MRLPIRVKLAGALGVPLAALAVVTATEVTGSIAEAREVREQTSVALTVLGPESIVTTLQVERDITVVTMVGMQGAIDLAVEDIQTAQDATDQAVIAFRDYIEDQGPTAQAAYANATRQIDQLAEVRASAEGYEGENTLLAAKDATDAVYVAYGEITRAFLDGNREISAAVDDLELRRGTRLIDLAARQLDIRGDLTRALLLGALSPGGLDTSAELRYLGETIGLYDDYLEEIRSTASGSYRQAADVVLSEERLQQFRAQADIAVGSGAVDIPTVYATSSNPVGEGYDQFHDDVAGILRSRADELNRMASVRERSFVALGVLTLGAAIVMTWFITRSIVKPLRSLTRQASALAVRDLPNAVHAVLATPLGQDVQVPHVAPVEVRSNDEIADVAARLNAVQDTAIDLAVEQAVLRRNIADSFVSLGRRNQNLLGRQLDFITELEAREADSDTLANLFQLDHLATRMRRNAESLLVLAGIEPARTWTAPVALTDVLRAALGEVEDYRRVSMRAVAPVAIVGSAAADMAHVIAELIENALRFSPPLGPSVDLSGGFDESGYTLQIVDAGIGMPPDELAESNRRLAGAESFTVAPSRYLGHYVAGHLAARHGITVQLRRTPGGGVTAALHLPPDLLAAQRAPAPASDGAVAPVRRAVGAGVATSTAALPRRAPGAQRPDRAVHSIRRWPGPSGPPPNPGPSAQVRRSAEDVYMFLTSFTAGVERGLAGGSAGAER